MRIIISFIFFLYGAIFGSFFNVVGIRVPIGTFFKQDRSYCDNCQRNLGWSELVPILSYLVQGGSCKKCDQNISPMYPIMETLTGVLFAFTYLYLDFTPPLILGLLLISLIIPTTVSDIAYQIIPNKILLFFAPLFFIYRFLYPLTPWWDAILGAGVSFLLVLLIIIVSKGGMGMGDLKFYTLFGFIFGVPHFLLLFFLSTLYGVVAGVIKMKLERTGGETRMAFGPFIGMAALTVFYFGDSMIQWYLQFFY